MEMHGLLLFLNIGTSEMILIIVAILFLFGGKKLPELARGLGRGIREFKDASESIKRDINEQINNFEEDVKVVKSDMKAITQDSAIENKSFESKSDPINVSEKPEVSENRVDASDKNAINDDQKMASQSDVETPQSDQYYKNYDYNYPEDPKG